MREQSLRNRIQKLDNDIMDKERRIEQRAQNLTQQFARLQSSLSNMQRQSQYLASALPGAGSGNMVSQLLG
jgi:flagellar capping protein FliD